MQLLKIIAYKERYIWLASVYLTRGTEKQIQALFQKIQNVLHPVEVNNLLLVCDWNVDISESSARTELLRDIAKQFKLKIVVPAVATRKHSTIDFALIGQSITDASISVVQSPSDHKCLIVELGVQITPRCNQIFVPNKKLAAAITRKALLEARDSLSFLQLHRRYSMGHKPLSPIRRKKCDNKILELLLNCDGIEDIRTEIKQYWHSA